ncbi:hypothetical protein ACTQ7D_003606, partial [Vibrio fluvialis]
IGTFALNLSYPNIGLGQAGHSIYLFGFCPCRGSQIRKPSYLAGLFRFYRPNNSQQTDKISVRNHHNHAELRIIFVQQTKTLTFLGCYWLRKAG